jgi:hypothetical protein
MTLRVYRWPVTFRSDSLLLFGLLAALAIFGGWLWSACVLPPYNSNHLGCDACHHAVLIHYQGQSTAPPAALLEGLADYPQTSHWLAARFLPFLDGDPYKAMRATAFATVILTLVCQYFLLRRVLPAAQAVLGTLVLQMVCYQTQTAETQYFCVAYFFAQAVGMLAVWLAVLFATQPAGTLPGRVTVWGMAVLCAALAYLCHIVPGAVVLGALGLFSLLRLIGRPRGLAAIQLLILAAVGGGIILGTNRLSYMAACRGADGSVPVKNTVVMFSWLPTLIAALAWQGRRLWKAEIPPADDLVRLLICLLCVAGGLQAYCAYEWAFLGKAAAYSVLKFFYVLFPVSVLVWVLALAQGLQALWRLPSWSWPTRLIHAGLIAVLCYFNGRIFIRNELLPSCPDPERSPVRVARVALAAGAAEADLLYYDPTMPQSSVFVNVVGLHRSFSEAYSLVAVLHGWRPDQEPAPDALAKQVHFSRLVVAGLTDRSTRSISANLPPR